MQIMQIIVLNSLYSSLVWCEAAGAALLDRIRVPQAVAQKAAKDQKHSTIFH